MIIVNKENIVVTKVKRSRKSSIGKAKRVLLKEGERGRTYAIVQPDFFLDALKEATSASSASTVTTSRPSKSIVQSF